MTKHNERVDVLAPLKGEGDIKVVIKTRQRRECNNCGEAATKRLSFCYLNGRLNPASSMYGRDDSITNRKKVPRKTIRLAMDAVLMSIRRKHQAAMVILPERPSPALGRVNGSDAYSGVQMFIFGRACAEAQRVVGTSIDLDVIELIEATKSGSATLGHAYHTILVGELANLAHADYQRMDAALARIGGDV